MAAVSFFSSFLSSLCAGAATNANPSAQQSNIRFMVLTLPFNAEASTVSAFVIRHSAFVICP
jgi:hypothetical protein